MSSTASLLGNPFAALVDPSAVAAACQASVPLKTLRSAVHRPLDKPRVFLDSEAAAFDAAIDAGLPALPGKSKPEPASAQRLGVDVNVPVYDALTFGNEDLVLTGQTRFPAEA